MGKENKNSEELHGGKGEEEEIENGEELHGGENEEGEGKEFITNYYDDDLFLEQKATLRKKYKNYQVIAICNEIFVKYFNKN